MNFQHVNPHNVEWLVPKWVIDPFQMAKALDEVLADYGKCPSPNKWDKRLSFWIECESEGERWRVCIKEPVTDGDSRICGNLMFVAPEWTVSVPLNPMLKGAVSTAGQHCVYGHTILVDCPLPYVGVTKRRWYERLAEHEASARAGSPYLFHRALRDHAGARMFYRVLLEGLDQDYAMKMEEEFVSMAGLYPIGLNMIPGGYAGIRYLNRLGILARSPVERDEALERLSACDRTGRDGKPNPLCAALWENDPSFAERVICGHSGRLSAAQVRAIRSFSGLGLQSGDIAARIGAALRQVRQVLSGQTYARIA